MGEPNDQLRRARERIESPYATGESLSRQELAELVNAWVYEHTEDHRVIELDANYIGKLEQGTIRWLRDPERRAAFRAVLGVTTDAELGSRRPRRSRTIVIGVERQRFLRVGLGVGAAAVAGPTALAALLPTQPTRVPSVVGMAQVAEVRAAAERRRRREQADQEHVLGEPTSEWMVVGDRRMFVVGYTAGGAPYGCYEDEFDEESCP